LGFSNSALTAKRVAHRTRTHTQQMASETGIKINGRRTGQWRARLMLDAVTVRRVFPRGEGICFRRGGAWSAKVFCGVGWRCPRVLTAVCHATSIQIALSRPARAPPHHAIQLSNIYIYMANPTGTRSPTSSTRPRSTLRSCI
jgi:hypothetical protein